MQKINIFNDAEFQSLDSQTKKKYTDSYFNERMIDDDFTKLDDVTQEKYRVAFAKTQVDDFVTPFTDKEKQAAQKAIDKIDEYIPDFAEDIIHGSVKNFADYTASGAKLFGADELQRTARLASETFDKNTDNKYVGMAGEMLGDPVSIGPAGIITKGTKLARVAKSVLAGAGVGATTVAAKNYGDDTLSADEKKAEMGIGAGFVSVINGIVAAATKGKVTNAVKNISDIEAIKKEPQKFGITEDEATQISSDAEQFLKESAAQKVSPELGIKTDNLDKDMDGWKSTGEEVGVKLDVKADDVVKEETSMEKVLNDTTKTPEQKIQFLETQAKDSLRKAEFEASLDNADGVALHEADAKMYTDGVNTLQKEINPHAKELPTMEELQAHPRYQELLDMRRDVSAKDAQSPQRLVQGGAGRELDGFGGTDKQAYDKAVYEKNYANDFELTKADVKKLENGTADEEILAKLERDQGVLDNHPDYDNGQNFEMIGKAEDITNLPTTIHLDKKTREVAKINDSPIEAYLGELLKKHPERFKNEKDVYKHIVDVKNSATHFTDGTKPINAMLIKHKDGITKSIGIERNNDEINILVHALASTKPNELKRLVRKQLEGSSTPSLQNMNGTNGANAHSATSHETIIPQDAEKIKNNPNILHANGAHSLAGGFAGGTDSLINQRDYNQDGEYDYKDLLAGVAAGVISVSAAKKLAPKLFVDDVAGGKVGAFGGDNPSFVERFKQPKRVSEKKILKENGVTELVSLPDETKAQLLQRKMQDKFNRVGQLINLKSDMNKIDDVMNPYQKEELYHGKVKDRLEEFELDTVTPIIEKFSRGKFTLDDVDEYLWARHAPERNKRIFELNTLKNETGMDIQTASRVLEMYKDSGIDRIIKKLNLKNKVDENEKNILFEKFSAKDINEYMTAKESLKIEKRNMQIGKKNGSGMSDEDAYKIINKYKDNKAMNEIVTDVYNMNKDRLRFIKNEGLESDTFVGAVDTLYDNYVPLKREFKDKELIPNTGKGFSIGGKEFKKAKGSDRAVESPFIHSILAFEETIVRAEKNEVGKAFLKFTEEFPDDSLYTIKKVGDKSHLNKENGSVSSESPDYVPADHLFNVKRDGELYEISIHDKALASAFKNLNSSQQNGMLNFSHKIIRTLALFNTSWNSEFVVSNFERDIQTAMINLPKEIVGDNAVDMAKNHAKIVAHAIPAMKGIYAQLRNTKGKNEWSELFKELRKEGGTTGWHDLHNVTDIKKNIEDISKKFDGKMMPTQKAKEVFKYIDDINDMVENSSRLIAYRMAKDSGLSNAKAASIAKNLTVNFNRKGEMGTSLNALYMFYNASVQGSTRMVQALSRSKMFFLKNIDPLF